MEIKEKQGKENVILKHSKGTLVFVSLFDRIKGIHAISCQLLQAQF